VEVKFGYSDDLLVRRLARKYKSHGTSASTASKVVLVIDRANHRDWDRVLEELSSSIGGGIVFEVWDEERLRALLAERFGVTIAHITPAALLDVRQAIDRAKGFHAFGGPSLDEYEHEPLKAELLWHFGFWRLQHLRSAGRRTPGDILPPGSYRGVAVLLADLCSFSSYVRDTADHDIVRESLTSFYSKARYQIINSGGMLYQFVGDEVIGLFGIPDQPTDFSDAVLDTAHALCRIGESVSQHWQRRIDRVQSAGGVHVGIALGEIQVVSLRPFSRLHVGAIGDCINVASRLLELAKPGEVVLSNAFHQALSEASQARCQETAPVEARHVGHIKAWTLAGPA
jgi:adenylate cyclase